VDQCSFWLDIRILAMTVRAVTAAEGSAPSCAPEYRHGRQRARRKGGRIIQSAPCFLALQSAQEQEWKRVLARVAQDDFYHLAEYHRLAEERGEGTANLFAYHDGAYTIAPPLLLRPIQTSGGEAWSECDFGLWLRGAARVARPDACVRRAEPPEGAEGSSGSHGSNGRLSVRSSL
jgi:hypothetical protein